MAPDADEFAQGPSTLEHSQRPKRRRTSERPARSDERLKSHDPSLSRQRAASGSSRDTMNRSSTSPSASNQIKFTKTGRVSKATKGERVHACDECDRVYTRNEHLRRHKKNHSPGAFPCDIPGCGRSFFREDLLSRHKQRHNDPVSSPGRKDSAASQGSGHVMRRQSSTYVAEPSSSSLSGLQPDIPVSNADFPASQLSEGAQHVDARAPVQKRNPKGYLPMQEFPRRSALSLDTSTSYSPFGDFTIPPSCSPPNSAGYASPSDWPHASQPYYQPQPQRYRSVSRASFLAYQTYPTASRSPISAGSGMPLTSTVGFHASYPALVNISTPSSDTSHGAHWNPASYMNTPHVRRHSSTSPLQISPDERDLMEQSDLETPTVGNTSYGFGPHVTLDVFDIEERYLGAYWHAVHPVWSVIHKPDFKFATTSPLLRAAMIALGAQATGDATDLSNARILHERCMKVLKKRTSNNWHTFRVCDMQAILLIEVYLLFRSRRPPLQVSRCFEDVFRRLANDLEAYPSHAMRSMAQMPEDHGDLSISVTLDIQRQCKQRLLVACYILDRQQSMLFGRHRSNCLSVPGEHLPFPQSSVLWDLVPGQNADLDFGTFALGSVQFDYTYEAMSEVPTMTGLSPDPHDVFRSMHMIACVDDVVNGNMLSSWKPMDDLEASAILLAIEQSPRTRLAYHTSMLCKHTPVRDLLAVAGESWIMAEKMTDQRDYSASQLETSAWARNVTNGVESPIISALSHALQILDIHREHPRTGMLFQEWSVYLATLVIWIRSYVSSERQPQRRLSTTEARLTPHEAQQSLIATIRAGASAAIEWKEASGVLLWTKSRLELVNVPHNCGLTNGALDVIGKLVTRGHEDTWLR